MALNDDRFYCGLGMSWHNIAKILRWCELGGRVLKEGKTMQLRIEEERASNTEEKRAQSLLRLPHLPVLHSPSLRMR